MVSETGADCVSIFSCDIQKHLSVGSHGKGPSHLSGSADVVMDDNDRILVVGRNNHCIQFLTMEGPFLVLVQIQGEGPLQSECPTSIIVHLSGQVLVSERNSSFDPSPR